jgi:hypothetical protein
MRQGLTAAIAAADADPDSSQTIPLEPRPRWKRFAIIGLVAYLVALVAVLPARFAMDWGQRWQMSGTVWNGEAVLDGAYRLTWRWAPLRSLASLAFAADVRVEGPGTDIAGAASSRGGALRFDGLAGQGDGALLTALDRTLPFTCEMALDINLPRLVIDRGRTQIVGEVRTGSGRCAGAGQSASATVPPLIATMRTAADGSTEAALAPVGQGRLHLMEGSIAQGRLKIGLTPAGEAAMPFAQSFQVDHEL